MARIHCVAGLVTHNAQQYRASGLNLVIAATVLWNST
jgi:hypothetical protein